VSEFETEYAPGLPAPLPKGERLLWQGKPLWRSLAVHAFHVRSIAIYFAILTAWRGTIVASDGADTIGVVAAMGWIALLALAAISVLGLLAWLSARSTIYTITDRRILMRFGIALPITLNIPLRVVDAVSLSRHRDLTGDIAVSVGGSDRAAYLLLWPHARPWRVNRPEPMLRSLVKCEEVAKALSRALEVQAGQAARPLPDFESATPAPAGRPLATAAG
jgi:PH (Pleckstrin Homology) domain-containing protein